MRVQATSIDDYFSKADEREPDLRELDALITKTVPKLPRKLFNAGMFTGIGYGIFHYKTKSGLEGDWPLIALANQKNYISLYVSAAEDGKYLAEENKSKLGKVSVGKSCIRFKKLADVNLDNLKDVLKKAEKLGVLGHASL